MAILESREVRDEQFWRDGGGFRWCWPHFNIVLPADKRVRSGLNRYPHNVIGAYVVIFGRSWGVRWKESFSSSRLRARAIRKGGIGSDEAYQIWKRAPTEAVRSLAGILVDCGYGTKQADKDAAVVADRLAGAGWLRKRRASRTPTGDDDD